MHLNDKITLRLFIQSYYAAVMIFTFTIYFGQTKLGALST